jgi:exonuclease III
MKIVFWNLGRKNLLKEVNDLLLQEEADIFIFSEYSEILKATPNLQFQNYRYPNNFQMVAGKRRQKVIFLIRSGIVSSLVFESASNGYRNPTILVESSDGKFLIMGVHLQDKRNYDDYSRHMLSNSSVSTIEGLEKEHDTNNSIIIGDFNMNPFENSMVRSTGFHAIGRKNVASKISRQVEFTERLFFYNPMWKFLTPEHPEPAGTYYFDQSDLAYHWNTFDQAIFRPSLIEYIENISIVQNIYGNSLLDTTQCKPNISSYSDHLPISVKLSMPLLP